MNKAQLLAKLQAEIAHNAAAALEPVEVYLIQARDCDHNDATFDFVTPACFSEEDAIAALAALKTDGMYWDVVVSKTTLCEKIDVQAVQAKLDVEQENDD